MSPDLPLERHRQCRTRPIMRASPPSSFADWRLKVDGLVARPLSLSLDQIRRMPRRTQITRHDCVEGWSAIGKWTGVPLSLILDAAGLQDDARYIVFHCVDRYRRPALLREHRPGRRLPPADHPRLGHERPAAPGRQRRAAAAQGRAPARLQAGQISCSGSRRSTSLAGLYGGKGGYWEDSNDYEWYAGI